MATGTIVSVDQAKSMLREANKDYYGRKTWQSLYGNIALQEQQAMSSLTQDYASDVAEAYASAYQNKQAVAASNIGQGYKTVAQENIDAALAEAFETYQANYLSGVSQVAQSSAKQVAAVSELEQKQAEKVSALADKPYEYLQSMWAQYKDSYNKDLLDEYSALDDKSKAEFLEQHPEMQATINNLFNNPNWQKYLTQRTDADTGEAYYDLMTWDELAQARGFYDENKSLTMAGTDFFDQMINEAANLNIPGVQSFGEWLKGSDAELYDWATSDDAFNYSLRGNNMGTFQQYVGMMSSDQQYQFVERYGGMNSDEVKGLFDSFNTKLNNIGEQIYKDANNTTKIKDIVNNIGAVGSDVDAFIKQLGIDSSELDTSLATIAREAGLVSANTTQLSIKDFSELLTSQSFNADSTVATRLLQVIQNTGSGFVGGLATGAGLAATSTIGGAVAAGPYGAAAGAGVGVGLMLASTIAGTFIGLAKGIGEAVGSKREQRQKNIDFATSAQKQMQTLITTLTAYAEQQRRLKQEGY